MTLIMALDQGTTSSRTVLVNARGEIVGQSSAPLDCPILKLAGLSKIRFRSG